MSPYFYSLHGLQLKSAVRLPELPDAAESKDVDIEIRLGAVADEISHVGITTEGHRVAHDAVLVSAPHVGRYLIEGGRTITVENAEGADEALVRFYLLGASFVPLLFQRGEIPLHAGAVTAKGKAIAFFGFSMAGKSTLVAALSRRGYSAITDDRLILKRKGAEFLAVPSVPVLNLALASAEFVGIPDATLLRSTINFGKRIHRAWDTYGCELAQLRAMVFLEWSDAVVSLERLDPFEALSSLREQVNYESYLRLLNRENEFLEFAASLVMAVPSFRLSRPRTFDALADTIDALEKLPL